MGHHWIEDCPESNQNPKPVDFQELLNVARQAAKNPRRGRKAQRAKDKHAGPPEELRDADNLPQIHSAMVEMNEGVELMILPAVPIERGAIAKLKTGAKARRWESATMGNANYASATNIALTCAKNGSQVET